MTKEFLIQRDKDKIKIKNDKDVHHKFRYF
jgi:hypothetical protein